MLKCFFLVLCYCLTSIGAEGFHCVPSLRQTRIQVLKKNNQIELLVINPDGYEFMPQFDAASVFSLSFNKMQGEDLSGLGDGFSYVWDANLCDLDSEKFVVNCSGEARHSVNRIKSFGISTTEVIEKSQKQAYEKRRYRLNVENENTYFVNLEFYASSCEKFEEKK